MSERPELEQITNCLYAVIQAKFRGAVKLTKREMEDLPNDFSLDIHIEKESGDLIISTVQPNGKPN